MAKGMMTLSYDEKAAIAAGLGTQVWADEGFVEPPQKTLGQPSVEWEKEFPLDIWRRHIGLGKAIMKVLPDDGDDLKKSKALAAAIKNRLMVVFPSESWAVDVHEGELFLRFAGARVVRTRR